MKRLVGTAKGAHQADTATTSWGSSPAKYVTSVCLLSSAHVQSHDTTVYPEFSLPADSQKADWQSLPHP